MRSVSKRRYISKKVILSLLFVLIFPLGAYIFPYVDTNILGTQSQITTTGNQSKLGVYIFDWSKGGENILLAGPKVVNVYNPHEAGKHKLRVLLHRYKKKYPDGKLILHIATLNIRNIKYTLNDDPVKSADSFWNDYTLPAINQLSKEDLQLFDYVTGTNEYDNTPAITSPRDLKWMIAFWIRLADDIHASGFKPNIGEIPVGNIEVNEPDTYLPPFVPLLKKLKSYGGIWSYHGYSLKHTKSIEVEKWWTFRYRFFYDYLNVHAPEVADIPMVLTEAGFDLTGDRLTSGWQAYATADAYRDWLAWFDSEIQKDPQILAATVYQIGDTYWKTSDLEPLADWYVSHLTGLPITTATPSTMKSPVIPSPTPVSSLMISVRGFWRVISTYVYTFIH